MKKSLVTLLALGAAASIQASDYGCKVLLCLANPASNGGPKGVAECVEPINKLYYDLRKGRPFPSCDLADGSDGSSYARQVHDPYDPCPTDLQPAKRGAYIVQGTRKTKVGNPGWWSSSGSYTLSGKVQVSELQNEDGDRAGARACVGNPVGSYAVGNYDDSYTVNVFDQVVWQPAHNPRAIDVYIDRRWYQRVRW